MDDAILKCLEKDRDLRCQSAAELRADLKRIKRGSSASGSSGRVTTPAFSSGVAAPSGISSQSAVRASAAGDSLAQPASPALEGRGWDRRRRLQFLVRFGIGVLIGVVIFAGFALYNYLKAPKTVINPLAMQITKLTEDGAAVVGAISPDGRYAAFIKRGEQSSLWVKQIATGSEAQVVPPGPGHFNNRPTFSPDGNYIYYDHSDAQNEDEVSLYSVPSLGGTPQRIVDDVSTPVSFSPDGKQIVFAHFDTGDRKAKLVIAQSDGTSRHTIAEREAMAINGAVPSWSGDGKLIAVPQYVLTKEGLSNVLIFTPDGTQVKSFPYPFLVDGIAWLPDSSGMFLQERSREMNFRNQIKFQPYPAGPVQNVTNDLNEYHNITVTADGKALATTQMQSSSAIYIGSVPGNLPGEIKLNPTPITKGQADGGWMQWGSDGKIYFTDSDFHSFRIIPDGSARARVPDRDTNAAYPISCGPDAVVFANLKDNMLNLFRQSLSTGEIKQLTSERDAEWPTCSKDGKSVYYSDNFEGPALKRVSPAGNPPEMFAPNTVMGASLSPDQKRIAFVQFSGTGGEHKAQIVVQAVDGTNKVSLPATELVSRPDWSPDGRALILVKRTGPSSNLFYQPLDGSSPTQITHFDTEPLGVATYSFSPDGKQIAITRARTNDSDLVMFSNFR